MQSNRLIRFFLFFFTICTFSFTGCFENLISDEGEEGDGNEINDVWVQAPIGVTASQGTYDNKITIYWYSDNFSVHNEIYKSTSEYTGYARINEYLVFSEMYEDYNITPDFYKNKANLCIR